MLVVDAEQHGGFVDGNVLLDGLLKSLLQISNDGNATLTVSGLTGPCATQYSVSWTSGSIAAGQMQNVGVRFAPSAAQNCSGIITVNGDQTSGTNTISSAVPARPGTAAAPA